MRGTKSNIYKVAHHGSKTGHHVDVWRDILDVEPLALLTPFRHGSCKIPDHGERANILALTKNAYISADPNAVVKPSKKSNKV